ncbi:caffeine-induced death protein 2-domain-containing protein [Mrakia frigida]|uniref:MIX23 family protein n=1 Tax=Mrakia frigida TaxID=29902 RepID=UPI003FCC1531
MSSSSSSPSSDPPIGTPSIYYPKPPANFPVSPSTCLDFSLFKEVIKDWRKVDDSIVVRINRSSAQSRDEARSNASSSSDGGCAQVFREMTASWTNRAILLSYCSDVLNKAMPPPTTPDEVREATRKKPSEYSHLWEGEMEAPDKAGRRDVGRSEVEVLQRRYATEGSVEDIVRKRSMTAFRSRCPFFPPPPPDTDAGKWWIKASSPASEAAVLA